MRILIANTYHYLRGGDCRHALASGELLERKGHSIHHFAMMGRENRICKDEKYFISEFDYRKAIKAKNPLDVFRVVWRSIYSFEARKNIGRLLNKIKPDVAHLHSIRHHLTTSILLELVKRKIPVVWTLHDYKEICPNTSFYHGRTICEDCKGEKYANILRNRCKKGSLAASLVTYLEAKINNWLDYEKHVALYISPSNFLRHKFIEYGYDPQKVVHLPNFMELDDFLPHYGYENYLLFIGRLEREKGLETLIRAFARITNADRPLSLKIAGTGSMERELKGLVERMRVPNVEFLGFKQGTELEDLMKNAKAILIPSEWYENYPFSGLEAMAYGKPIIGSRIGGIPEQVEDGVTGFLFEPFSTDDLAAKMDLLNSLPDSEVEKMGKRAREKVERENNSQVYLSKILQIYEELIENKKRKAA